MPEDREALRIHAFMPASRANGPGVRAILWLQGCTLGCPGCFNPATHPAGGGEVVPVTRLADQFLALSSSVEGMTISGGEPLQQIHGLLALLEAVTSRSKLSVVVFTGYTWDEVQRMEGALVLLGCVDVLVAGRYDRERRSGAGLRGSDNQTVHLLTDRYTLDDLEDVPVAEAVIEQDGAVTLSGFPGAFSSADRGRLWRSSKS